jgi:hypothetical protein
MDVQLISMCRADGSLRDSVVPILHRRTRAKRFNVAQTGCELFGINDPRVSHLVLLAFSNWRNA